MDSVNTSLKVVSEINPNRHLRNHSIFDGGNLDGNLNAELSGKPNGRSQSVMKIRNERNNTKSTLVSKRASAVTAVNSSSNNQMFGQKSS